MQRAGATSHPARGGSARRTPRTAGLALPLGLGCGILAAAGALLARTDLAARLFPPAATEHRVAIADAPVRSVPRVVEPPLLHAKPAAPRVARAAAAPVRRRMPAPVLTAWLPAHLLDRPEAHGIAGFDASAETVRIAAVASTGRFVPDETAVVVAAEPHPAAAPERSVLVAAAVPVEPSPETAEAALEAALVPTPSARPRRADAPTVAPAVATLKTRAMPPQALAYARPDLGDDDDDKPVFGGLFSPGPRAGNGVAVYDIGAATVYLPNGEKLEAHSGLGAMRDNPRFVHAKNRGPTPPHTYDLRMRESLFHGVAAIRLTPVGGERRIYNRVGLLAHTYMLGPRGDSNGCVSFKDYRRFLAAFRRGEVRRLVVVPHMNDASSRVASLFGRRG